MATSLLPVTPRNLSLDRLFPAAERPKCSRQLHSCKLERTSTPPDGVVGLERVTSQSMRAHLPQPVTSRRRFVELGCGLLASTMTMTVMTMNCVAEAAEEEIKEEESCELTFAPSGLGYCDVIVGTGMEPPQGELIMEDLRMRQSLTVARREADRIHYTGRFEDGKVFDSSYKRGRPLTLRIGVGKVIPGWDLGILGGDGVPPMLAGGKRKLRVPPELAYGQYPVGCYAGKCNIPGNSTLLYDMVYVGPYTSKRY